jgi:orotate phosphoribosyltransferase
MLTASPAQVYAFTHKQRSLGLVEPQDVKHDAILELFRERKALLEGHFLLSSGLHSPRYLQSALVLMDPPVATRLGAELSELLKPILQGTKISTVVGPALGGVIVAHEVARALSCRAIFTERLGDAMVLRRGFTVSHGESVVIVEDVITTGRSTQEVMDVIRSAGCHIAAVGSLIDRTGGAVDLGVPRRSLLRIDVPTYPAESCPMCAQGTRPEKPGSRPDR